MRDAGLCEYVFSDAMILVLSPVPVYTLNSSTNAWDLQQEIAGEAPGDVFGRGIAVNDVGTLLSASSYTHNDNRGQVRVFELVSNTWVQKAEFEGDQSGDQLGFNTMGVDMTKDGSRLAMSSSRAQANGNVQVFKEDGVIVAPEGDNMVSTFDWDIEFLPNATEIAFSEDADTSELVRQYFVAILHT
jgi:hypothetical protein